jgi:hypothetical protein
MIRGMKKLVLACLLAAACGGTEKNTVDAGVDAAANAPHITQVSWNPTPPCTTGTTSNFSFSIDATDPDTPANMLTYTITSSGCTGATTGAGPWTLSCHNVMPYPGSTATVKDPQNHSDSVTFTIQPCKSGTATH